MIAGQMASFRLSTVRVRASRMLDFPTTLKPGTTLALGRFRGRLASTTLGTNPNVLVQET